MRTIFKLLPLSVACLPLLPGVNGLCQGPQDQALVERALRNELSAAQDNSHPMRYQLRKSSPRLETVKEIVETRDGSVAKLIEVDRRPLTSSEVEKDETRLNGLLADPGRQRHRKQTEADDTARALKILRALPNAFIFQSAGTVSTPTGPATRYTFIPNPRFDPPDLETQVLRSMRGELWVDPVHVRVEHLEGYLQQDVDIGWGLLGRLYKGGWIVMEQGEVAPDVWRVLHFQMKMSGRVLFRTKTFDTTEDQSRFSQVPTGLTYQQGIAMLRSTTLQTKR